MQYTVSLKVLYTLIIWVVLTVALAACGRNVAPDTGQVDAPQATAPVGDVPATDSAEPTETSTVAPTPTATALPAQEAPTQAPLDLSPSGLDAATEAAVDQYLATVFQGAPFSGAVLIAQGDTVLLSKGYGMADRAAGIPNTPQTRFRLGSVTKPFTAVAILMLHAEGKLELDAPVCRYLATCPAAWGEMTVAQILSHTAGIPDLTRFPDFETTKGNAATPDELLARFSDVPLDFPPGARWQYSNSGYIVLGAVIEQVSGQAYDAFMQEHIFAPLGMDATGYDHNLDTLAVGYTPAGNEADFIHMSIPFAAGGLYSTVEDMLRWDRALTTDALLPQALRNAMFSIHAPMPSEGPNAGYGYGWIVRNLPGGKIVEHNGVIEGFSAGIQRYLDEDAVIIVLSNEEARHIDAVIDGLENIVLRGETAP